jgi:Protein of unknown function (DUF3593)
MLISLSSESNSSLPHCTAKIQYGTTLANVDWLHGGAESMLTLTNLFIVIGLRRAIRDEKEKNRKAACMTETAERTETVE